MSGKTPEPEGTFVAVIGMAGRFPGANSVEEFWHNLCEGVESIVPVPDQADPEHPEFHAAYGVLDRADEFDADFFRYSPNDALIIDPQQRLFLECAHEALERAGYGAAGGRGSVGVFAGGATTGYRAVLQSQLHRLPFADEWTLRLATAPDFLATRTAHKLDLDGPAISVQTACSTGLVAVHLAMQALVTGDCQVALAGGASVHVPYPIIRYTEGGIVAPDGHCRAFDANARGGIGGSAVAVVVLKPLADALADGDSIHAVLRGSAVNNDGGGKIGFTAPSVDGQARAIRAAHVVAEVEAETITYVEAHGTGTPLGDSVEVAALTSAFRTGESREGDAPRRGYCALGSVKTNIGHTDAAAGICGFVKAVLAVEHGVIPPTLHFERPNPDFELAASPFVVNDSLRLWRPSGPRRAGVSALGVGGTNAHVVVEEPPSRPVPSAGRPHELLVVSARTPEALEAATRRLGDHLRTTPGLPLADVAWTLQVGRQPHAHRRFAVCASPSEAAAALASGAGQGGALLGTQVCDGPVPEIVFMFPGQGSQHVGMARELYEHEPEFRRWVDECAEEAVPEVGLDLRAVLYAADDGSTRQSAARRLDTIAVGQPAVFVVEYALARLLLSWGIQPRAVIGHSLGAYAAACVAGVLSPQDAVRLVAQRGRLLESLPAGAMLAVRLPAEEVARLLPEGLTIAAVNGPRQCSVSGASELVRALARDLGDRGVETRELTIATAGHSPLVDPIIDEFRDRVAELQLNPPAIPFVSDTTGDWASPESITTPEYWAVHLRAPVMFGRALSTLGAGPERALIEVGPGRTLVSLAGQSPEVRPRLAIQTLPHPLEDTSALATALAAVGRLWSAGIPIRWERLHAQRRRRVVLPTYPFQRRRYLVHRPEPMQSSGPASGPARYVGTVVAGGRVEADQGQDPAAAGGLAPPTPSTTEGVLSVAFGQALGLDDVRADDDLFELGGDSLTATKLAAWGRRRFGVPFAAVDVIRARTVAACARLVDQRRRNRTTNLGSLSASWLACRRPLNDPAIRLYCFPHSGGAAGEYLRWADGLPGVEVWGVNLPGRGPRIGEPALTEMSELVDALLADVEFMPPFALFGHSFGALTVYEVALALRALGREQPDRLLLSAYPPPHVPRPAPPMRALPDSDLLETLGRYYGGVPGEFADDPELTALVLPAYRADLTVLETYRHRSREPLDRPLVVFGGTSDVFTAEQLAEWDRYTCEGCTVRLLAGGHFYFRERSDGLMAALRDVLSRRVDGSP